MARSRKNKATAKKKSRGSSKPASAKTSAAKKTKGAKRSAKASRRSRRPGANVYKAILEREPARRVARSTFEGLVAPETAAAAAEAAPEAATFTFVAVVSHDGPWELRSLIVNDFQLVDPTRLSTGFRIDVPIPAVFGSQFAINWSILAGHLIPGVATFIEPAGQAAVKLGDKAPLKKGESWAPLTPSTFP